MLDNIFKKVLDGGEITPEEAAAIYFSEDVELHDLISAASKIRDKFCGDKVDLCSIVNAKSGLCEHDCSFCAQSINSTANIDIYPIKSADEIIDRAVAAESSGAHRFCIVTSGGRLNDNELEIVVEALRLIKNNTSLMRCASLGVLNRSQVEKLVEAGLDRYHHNVETARSFYQSICTTQEYEKKIETILLIKESGLQTCIGGIFNLGETSGQRISMAFEIKKLMPDSVPVNFLNPRPGTILEDRSAMDIAEAIRSVAIYRFVLPQAVIRLAAGRSETFGCMVEKAAQAGINGLLIGDLLTTPGPETVKDLEMLVKLGFNTAK